MIINKEKTNDVSVVIIGAGERGLVHGKNILKYGSDVEGKRIQVTGIVEPDKDKTARILKLFPDIDSEMIFGSWQEFVQRGKIADAVVIATQDAMHKEPAVACAKLGYHILLEKPMALTPAGCQVIVAAVKKNDVIFGVCHVLRYTPFFQKLRELAQSGSIGRIQNIVYAENVGYQHFVHSYVRGPWRNERESSFLLLTKSIHDIDILRYLTGKPCRSVSSFGSLTYFRKENKPLGAGDTIRCIGCPYEQKCSYSAIDIYLRKAFPKRTALLVGEVNDENLLTALKDSLYGRCVYECDNDVVDHQVVNLEYESGITAAFTVSAFNSPGRVIKIEGSEGMITGTAADLEIKVFDFKTDKERTVEIENPADQSHGGGDEGLIQAWMKALATGDRSHAVTGPDETLEAHLTVFNAEKARRHGVVIKS